MKQNNRQSCRTLCISQTCRQFKRGSGYYSTVLFLHRTINMNSTSQNTKDDPHYKVLRVQILQFLLIGIIPPDSIIKSSFMQNSWAGGSSSTWLQKVFPELSLITAQRIENYLHEKRSEVQAPKDPLAVSMGLRNNTTRGSSLSP